MDFSSIWVLLVASYVSLAGVSVGSWRWMRPVAGFPVVGAIRVGL